MTVVSNIQSLRAGIQKALMETWRQKFPVYQEIQKKLLFTLPYVNLRTATYVFKDRIPFPKPWPYGKGRTYQIFQDRGIDIGIFPYEISIPYSIRDKEDDQLGDMESHVNQCVERFLQLPDVLINEYITGTASYNPKINLCYDGVALFSSVDGDGNDRFSVSGGNIVAGSGVGSNASIIYDFRAAKTRFLRMKEPITGQPLHSPESIAYKKFFCIIPSHLDAMFESITEQELIYSDFSMNTAQSNFLKGKFRYMVDQRLNDSNSWYILLEHEYWKPFAYRAPQNINQILATMQNSDRAREYAEECMYADLRIGIGPWVGFTMIKISN